jgi:hypothetical protein
MDNSKRQAEIAYWSKRLEQQAEQHVNTEGWKTFIVAEIAQQVDRELAQLEITDMLKAINETFGSILDRIEALERRAEHVRQEQAAAKEWMVREIGDQLGRRLEGRADALAAVLPMLPALIERCDKIERRAGAFVERFERLENQVGDLAVLATDADADDDILLPNPLHQRAS